MALPLASLQTASAATVRDRVNRDHLIDCVGINRLPLPVLLVLADPTTFATLRQPAMAIRSFVSAARWSNRVICEPPATAQNADRPIVVDVVPPNFVRVRPQASAATSQILLDHCDWVRAIDGATLIADLSGMPHVNSVVVAWLLRLAQEHAPSRLSVRGASPTAETQLRQLRLDHLVDIGG
ncbi:hypothetical protein LBMAG53_24980 [Planctomycetota bacterium]|nr:hypothetical protein LBMAG53_24980 [Planctomycetota bacterium]